MLSINTLRNAKLVDLPSDRARVLFFDLLFEAKIQKPEGVFLSMNVLRMAAKHRREAIPALLDSKLIHAVPMMCDRCRERFDDLPETAFVVHDWQDYQESSRVTTWRRDHGIASGHETLGKQRGNNGETTGKPSHVRAPAGASASLSLSKEERVQREEPDAAIAFHQRTGQFPGTRMLDWLKELGEAHGEARLASKIGSVPLADRKIPDYLRAVRDELRAEDYNAEKAKPPRVPRPARPKVDADAVRAEVRRLYAEGVA